MLFWIDRIGTNLGSQLVDIRSLEENKKYESEAYSTKLLPNQSKNNHFLELNSLPLGHFYTTNPQPIHRLPLHHSNRHTVSLNHTITNLYGRRGGARKYAQLRLNALCHVTPQDFLRRVILIAIQTQ